MEVIEWIARNSRPGTVAKMYRSTGKHLKKREYAFGEIARTYQKKGNNLWLLKGDKVAIKPKRKSLGVNVKGKVIKEYDNYYLIELESGRIETLHKVNTEYTIKKLN